MKDDNEKKLKSHSKHNFLMGVIHGIFYNAGIAFGSSNTVLPIFLDHFTGSRILVGLSSSIMGEGEVLKEGMAVAIEPMAFMEKPDVEVADDGWTVISKDRSKTAHFEHTVLITGNKPVIITG